MAKRPSLREVSKADAKQAADVAARIGSGRSMPAAPETDERLATVSYNLPADLVDLLRRVARQRADAIRAAKARGQKVEVDARQSASKIVLDALTPHVAEWSKELGE